MIKPSWARTTVGLLLMASAPALVSCRKPLTAQLEQPFDLGVGQVARLSGTDLEFRFRRVAADSRCPRDAECVWAGEALVTLDGRVMKGYPETFDVQLPGGASPSDSIPMRRYGGYRIQLLRLEPYPVSGAAPDSTAYVATFRVEER